MTVMEDKIVNTILSDDELLNYVEKLVSRRLPAGPHLKSDYNWYKQVIDLSINQAFEDLQVVDTLNYQISQLGKYLKKKSQRENQYINDESCEETDVSNGDIRSVDHPSFSSSEPIQRTRKPRKDTKRKSNYVTNGSKSDRHEQDFNNKHGNDDFATSSGQRPQANLNGSNHSTLPKKSARSKASQFEENEVEDDTQAGQLSSSTSYKSDLNNLPEKISNYSKFVAASSNLEKSIESYVDGNEFSLQFDISNSRGLSEFQKNSPSRYSRLQTRNETDSAEFCSQEEEDTEIRNLRLKVKPPLIPSLPVGSASQSTKGLKKSVPSTHEDYENDAAYLQPATRTDGNQSESFGKFGSSFEGIMIDRERKFDGDSEEKGKLGDNELRDTTDEVEEEMTRGHDLNGREVDDKDKEKEKEADDLYYNSDFDDNADDDDDDDQIDAPVQVTVTPKPIQDAQNVRKDVNNGAFTSWCMPSDNVARVRFVPDVVSDVFLIREKHSLVEIPNLFYTHDESIQFTSDYNRESMKAEAVGLTWYEWWEDRTEDDVLRDEKEQQEVEYEDESDGINGDLSDGSDNFNF